VILADTSIWVDHLSKGDPRMIELLDAGAIVVHPHVIGEIALGNLRKRDLIIGQLRALPQIMAADDDEMTDFIANRALFGTGLGYVDVHLLASTTLSPNVSLWSRDKRLAEAATRLGVAHHPEH